MKKEFEEKLINIAKEHMSAKDPSHDYSHVFRVYKIARVLSEKDNADMEIVIPSALFHDLVVHKKGTELAKMSTIDSANKAKELLLQVKEFPTEKISTIEKIIRSTSYNNPNGEADFLEAKIVKDADLIDATGAIALARTFAYCGVASRVLYDLEDPFAKNRQLDDSKFGIDHVYKKLLKLEELVSTDTAKKIAKRRTEFMRDFMKELQIEIEEGI